jgi:hypothetical protein
METVKVQVLRQTLIMAEAILTQVVRHAPLTIRTPVRRGHFDPG